MDHHALAVRLTETLHLDRPPIALAFVDERPADVPEADVRVPSACTFSRRAESGVFYAPAAAHLDCPVGAMTMGFELPAATGATLQDLVRTMGEWGYLADGEAASIPSVGRRSAGIVYGPLASFPVPPDAVLLWLTPRQAMVFAEGTGQVRWTEAEAGAVRGRPTSAALPSALASGAETLSLGCIGMRTYTAAPDDAILAVCPASGLGGLVDGLEKAAAANIRMADFYASRLAELAP